MEYPCKIRRVASTFFLLTITTLSLSAAVDLGTHGKTYDIAEENMWLEMKRLFKEEGDNITKKAEEGLVESMTAKADLPESHKNSFVTKKDVMVAPFDIRGAYGNIVYRKGQKIDATPMPKGVVKSMCFVRYTDDPMFDLIVEKFGTDCDYVISNTNVVELMNRDKYSHLKIYIYSKKLKTRFNIEALPTKLKLYENLLDYTTLNMDELREELRSKE